MSAWDLQLFACHAKGIRAARGGLPLEACPYVGHSGLNLQRADYWRDGWKAYKAGNAYDEHRRLREVSD